MSACFDFAPRRQRWRVAGRPERTTDVSGIEIEQARRLRSGVAKLEAQLDGVELRSRSGQQQVTVAHGMQGAGAAEGAADLVTADGFAHVMHHDQRGAGSFAQAQQPLAQRRPWRECRFHPDRAWSRAGPER